MIRFLNRLLGGFNVVAEFVRGLDLPPIATGLIFFAILYFARDIISIPFPLYNNFVIEERYANLITHYTRLRTDLSSLPVQRYG